MIERIDVGSGLVKTTLSNNMNNQDVGLYLSLSANHEFASLSDRVAKIEKVLSILHPSHHLHNQYPALKEAYDAYMMIETIITGKA